MALPHGSFHELQLIIHLDGSIVMLGELLDLVGLDNILLWSHVGLLVITRHGLLFNVLTTIGRQSNKFSNDFIKLKSCK